MPPTATNNAFNASLILAVTQPADLPSGWIKGIAGDYGTYYYHQASGTTQWEYPIESSPSSSPEPPPSLESDGSLSEGEIYEGDLMDTRDSKFDIATLTKPPTSLPHPPGTCQSCGGKPKHGKKYCTNCSYKIEGFPPGICHSCHYQMKQNWPGNLCKRCEKRARRDENDRLWEESYKKRKRSNQVRSDERSNQTKPDEHSNLQHIPKPDTATDTPKNSTDEMSEMNETDIPVFLPNRCQTCGDLPRPRPGTLYQGTLYCTSCYYLLVGFPPGVCHSCTSPAVMGKEYCIPCLQEMRSGIFVPLGERQLAKREVKQEHTMAKIERRRMDKRATEATATAPSPLAQPLPPSISSRRCQTCGDKKGKKSIIHLGKVICQSCSYQLLGFPDGICHGCAQQSTLREDYCSKCAGLLEMGKLVSADVKKARKRGKRGSRDVEKERKKERKKDKKWREKNGRREDEDHRGYV